jgi:hypothetical protein
MLKVLTYRIENGIPIITGDSSKAEIPVGDYQFITDGPILMTFKYIDDVEIIFNTLLQNNHTYQIKSKEKTIITIDGLDYVLSFKPSYIKLNFGKTINEHIIFIGSPRNTFKLYCELFAYLFRNTLRINMENKVNTLLDTLALDMKVYEIEDVRDGFQIRITSKEYYTNNLDFLLFLSFDNKMKFVHFFEHGDETYSSGNVPIEKETLLEEIKEREALLARMDEYALIFDKQLVK